MNNEEAIKSIDDVLSSDYHYDETLGYQLTSDDFEWLETAKSALEKQIPKRPTSHIVRMVEAPIKIRQMRFGEGTTVYQCPNCKEYVSKVYQHCPDCGQALDWSDMNDL